MTAPLLATEITKRYGTHTVLRDVQLQVDAGEMVLLLGPNGVGKSTLLGCVCGTVVPDQGTVTIGGHDLGTAPLKARAALRYLPQEVEVPPGLTGEELLSFYADVHGDAAGLARAREATQLGDALSRLAATYSVGMRRRLAFGGLQFGDAALYVLDEPFAGVDREGRARMAAALRAHLDAGAGLLLAVHDRDIDDLAAFSPRRFELTPPRAASDEGAA